MTQKNDIAFHDRDPKKIIKVNSETRLLKLLERINTNREVELIINDNNYAGIKKLLRHTESVRKLIKFNIHFSSFGSVSRGAEMLRRITFSQSKIISITFDNSEARGDNDITNLSIALQKQSALTALELRFGDLNKKEIRDLSKSLKGLNLTHLDLSYNHLNAAAVKSFSKALSEMTHLTYLDLSHNDLAAEGIEILSEALPDMEKLTYLDLKNNNIGVQGSQSLTTAILKRLKSIIYLGLRSNDLRNEGVKNLAVSLLQMKKLTHLDLGDNNIAEEGAIILAETIPHQLNYLDLSGNDIDHESLNYLKSILERRKCKIIRIIANLKSKIPSTKAFLASVKPLSHFKKNINQR